MIPRIQCYWIFDVVAIVIMEGCALSTITAFCYCLLLPLLINLLRTRAVEWKDYFAIVCSIVVGSGLC